jgi:hypothetical protein
MADESAKFEGEGTPQNVAFKLLEVIMKSEQLETRQKILDVYAECLQAAWGQRKQPPERT